MKTTKEHLKEKGRAPALERELKTLLEHVIDMRARYWELYGMWAKAARYCPDLAVEEDRAEAEAYLDPDQAVELFDLWDLLFKFQRIVVECPLPGTSLFHDRGSDVPDIIKTTPQPTPYMGDALPVLPVPTDSVGQIKRLNHLHTLAMENSGAAGFLVGEVDDLLAMEEHLTRAQYLEYLHLLRVCNTEDLLGSLSALEKLMERRPDLAASLVARMKAASHEGDRGHGLTCSTCSFLNRPQAEQVGKMVYEGPLECRRHGPCATNSPLMWPQVEPDHWCGEHSHWGAAEAMKSSHTASCEGRR